MEDSAITTTTLTAGELMALKDKVEDFFAHEGELLDERRFDAWLDL